MKTGQLTADVRRLLPLLKDRLYSAREVFLRELVSNAVDALAKMATMTRNDPARRSAGDALRIDIWLDPATSSLTIEDNGIGMTYAELDDYINHIAASGTAEFLKTHSSAGALIGAFGIGFYSVFLVADRIQIETKSYSPSERACWWESKGDVEFSMDFGDRRERGTKVILHLAPESREFLDAETVRKVVQKHHDFAPHPIYLNRQLVNSVQAPWHESRSGLTEKDYTDLYHRLFPEANRPRFWLRVDSDYPAVLRGILYVPDRPEEKGGIRLFCNRVFVDEHFAEAVPDYLGFTRGIIDAEGLPLNLSRERIQEDALVRRIRSFLANKIAKKFAELADTRRADYSELWTAYEAPLKLGSLQDDDWFGTLYPRLLFRSSRGGYTTLTEYLERANAAHPGKIYYLTDEHFQRAFLEAYRNRAVEVLYFNGDLDLLLLNRIRQLAPDFAEFARIDADAETLIARNQPKTQQPLAEAPETKQREAEQRGTEQLVEAERLGFAHFFSGFSGGADVELQELATHDLPILLRRKQTKAQTADVEDLLRKFKANETPTDPTQWLIILNARHPLIRGLATIYRQNRGSPALAKVCDVLYRHATVKFSVADKEATDSFLKQVESLLGWVCDEFERRSQ